MPRLRPSSASRPLRRIHVKPTALLLLLLGIAAASLTSAVPTARLLAQGPTLDPDESIFPALRISIGDSGPPTLAGLPALDAGERSVLARRAQHADRLTGCEDPRPITPIGEDFFTDISDASGIRDENFDPDPPDNMKINDHSRLAFADLDGDGYPDIVAHNLFPNPNQADPIPFEHLVYRNRGDGTYENVSDASGLRDVQAGFFAFGDVDNDGDQDVFAGLDIPIPRPDNAHRILLNDGKGVFSELPNSGVNVPFRDQNGNIIHFAGNAVFADFDGDAKLDLFVGNGQTSARVPDQIFMGRGDGTFTHEPERLLGDRITRPTNGSTTCDYDNDGDVDIFTSMYGVSVENGHNALWENDGSGRFTNVALERGYHALHTGNYFLSQTGFGRDPEPGRGPGEIVGGNGFGLQCADLNNDGNMDVFITNISHPVNSDYLRKWSDPSQVLINQGPSKGYAFSNEWLDRGLPFNEGDVDGAVADFDNDGLLDLSISRDRKYEGNYTDPQQKAWFGLMHQLPDGKFESVGIQSGINDRSNDPPELNRMKMAQNHAWADTDRDGDLDLLVGGRTGGKAGRPNFLFRNDIGSRNDWLAVELAGDGENVNRDAVGTKVELVFADRVLKREYASSRGMYNSIDGRALHFGLGDLSCDFTMRVTWPDGTIDLIPGADIDRNQYMQLSYGEPWSGGGTPEPTPSPAPDILTLEGRVYDATAGRPQVVAGATITVSVGATVYPPVTSDLAGRYALGIGALLPPDTEVSFVVSAEGYFTHYSSLLLEDLRSPKDFDLVRVTDEANRPTPTPRPSLMLSGNVSVGAIPLLASQDLGPIEGASILVSVCVPRPPFEAFTDAEGDYELEIPASPIDTCEELVFYVSAEGFEPLETRIRVDELWAQPVRDFRLDAKGGSGIYLPWLANREQR